MKKNTISFKRKYTDSQQLASGFTLIEMLVVISIITIMLSAGAIGLKNLSQTGGVSAAVPIAESIFAQARQSAIGKGAKARVLINSDVSDQEKYLRYMLVAYEWEDESGDTRWVTESRGTYLPQGVFFSQKFSYESHADSSGSLEEESMDIYGSIDNPSVNSTLSTSYFYYEFNAEGNMLTPGASFVINTGRKAPDQKYPRVTNSSINGFGGFVVWKKGTTSVFRHPDQVDIQGGIEAGFEF